jgi:hypothetical protein
VSRQPFLLCHNETLDLSLTQLRSRGVRLGRDQKPGLPVRDAIASHFRPGPVHLTSNTDVDTRLLGAVDVVRVRLRDETVVVQDNGRFLVRVDADSLAATVEGAQARLVLASDVVAGETSCVVQRQLVRLSLNEPIS